MADWTKQSKATLTDVYSWGTQPWGTSPWGGSAGRNWIKQSKPTSAWDKITKPSDSWTKITKAT